MERRINTIKENWLRSIAKFCLLKNKPPRIEEKRNEKSVKTIIFVRSIGNYSLN